MLYGAQLAQGLAELSTSTVTGSEIGLQVLSVPQVVILPTNIAAAWNDLDLDPRDVELYLVLRESARQRLFNAVSWLGPQLLAWSSIMLARSASIPRLLKMPSTLTTSPS